MNSGVISYADARLPSSLSLIALSDIIKGKSNKTNKIYRRAVSGSQCGSVPGVKTFLSHNYYEGTISFLPAEDDVGTPRDELQCRSG